MCQFVFGYNSIISAPSNTENDCVDAPCSVPKETDFVRPSVIYQVNFQSVAWFLLEF